MFSIETNASILGSNWVNSCKSLSPDFFFPWAISSDRENLQWMWHRHTYNHLSPLPEPFFLMHQYQNSNSTPINECKYCNNCIGYLSMDMSSITLYQFIIWKTSKCTKYDPIQSYSSSSITVLFLAYMGHMWKDCYEQRTSSSRNCQNQLRKDCKWNFTNATFRLLWIPLGKHELKPHLTITTSLFYQAEEAGNRCDFHLIMSN